MLTLERLHQLLKYDRKTGRWTSLQRRGRLQSGAFAGTLSNVGYWHIQVDGKKYLSSRLAWFYVTGEWPFGQVDHRDRDRANDVWENLRLATQSQNMGNTGVYRDSVTGLKGVSIRRDHKKKPFRAQIAENGKHRHIGYFSTAEEANAAYLTASRRVFGDFAVVFP
jgi:hypothetical protein